MVQRDCELKACLTYVMSSRPAWTMQQESITKAKSRQGLVMAQCLRVLAVLPEDLSLFPATILGRLQQPVTPAPEDPALSSGLRRHPHREYTLTYT